MELTGDPAGLEELKKIREERKDFLKFLITEAKTSFRRYAIFNGGDGRRWKLSFNGQRNELEVQPATDTDVAP